MASKSKPSDKSDELDVSTSYEKAIEELEQLVRAMESGDMSLEASLKAYQRGVALAKACQTHLLAAEQQVKVLEADLLRPFEDIEQESDQ